MKIKMAASDIVIHQGEKEEKYQLYVEDYVMSYLKNYGAGENGKIYFYGKREQKNKKYYIYGAGRERELACFAQYEPLDEIVCRLTADMPVFLLENKKETYELAGYYIFYQSNEAMQNYMVEQRKAAEALERAQNRTDARAGRKQPGTQGIVKPQNIIRPQNIVRPQNIAGHQNADRFRSMGKAQSGNGLRGDNRLQSDGGIKSGKTEARRGAVRGGRNKTGSASGNFKGGLMAMQLAAIFIVLIAIVINSTNSYTKLEELNQAAVEVFFAMENEEAADKENPGQAAGKTEDALTQSGKIEDLSPLQEDTAAAETEGTVLRLEDLDLNFEKENQMAKQEDNDGQTGTEDAGNGQDDENGTQKENGAEDSGNGQKENGAEDNGNGQKENGAEDNGNGAQKGNGPKDDDSGKETAEEQENTGEKADTAEQADAQTEEIAQSEQAFARNFAEYYKIEKGDTLYKISIKIYGDTGKVEEICELNKIKDPDNIKYGQKILLP